MNKYTKAVRHQVPNASPKHTQAIASALEFANIDTSDQQLVSEVVDDWYVTQAQETLSNDPMSGLAGGLYNTNHTDLGRCPACRGPMVGVTLAHNKGGSYCPLHRVVIPDRIEQSVATARFQHTRTSRYSVHTGHGGLEITNLHTNESAFLQGDDANELEDQLDKAHNNTVIDHLLSEYDHVMAGVEDNVGKK